MQYPLSQQPPQGAYSDLSSLIALRFVAGQLKLERKKRALNQLAGPNKSNIRGRGIDFEEVRSYQSGDDIRTIDWRVTARTGEAHTKLFREERERPVLIVTDQRNSLFFGSQHCFKSVLAANLTSLVAWSALNNGDRVGALIFSDQQHREIRPRRSRKTVLAILSEVVTCNRALPLALDSPSDNERFADMLASLRRIVRPGSSLYLISDFAGANTERAQEHLYQLAQHTELTAFACTDPLEQQLPRAGLYAVTNGQARAQLSTGDKRTRQHFATAAKEAARDLQRGFRRLGIPLLNFSTCEAPLPLLQRYYGGGQR